jgi:putative GTP pyrophosphokinase
MHHDPDAAIKEEQRLTGDEKYDIGYYGTDSITDEDVGRLLAITEQAEQFENMMMYFDCAMSQVRTKLEILNKEMALKNRRNPFEYIKSRLKSPKSIYGKLKVKGVPFTVENIENTINDVAGIRVICSFIDDIYSIRDSFDVQDDVEILQEKDYIASPKENGYRSLHLVVEVPVYLSEGSSLVPVEIQIRTIAMDFWATLEHNLRYKAPDDIPEGISDELQQTAMDIAELDERMQSIHDRLDSHRGKSPRAENAEQFARLVKEKTDSPKA